MTNSLYSPLITNDHSLTFFSQQWGETYHSDRGALQEAELKFILPLKLAEKAIQPSLKILDVCYGLGYNTGATLATIWSINPYCQVELIALELDGNVPRMAIATALEMGDRSRHILNIWPTDIASILTNLAETHYIENERLKAELIIGDARQTMQTIMKDKLRNMINTIDAILFDPFSPPVCPELWTVEFFQLVASCLKPDGRLATYSCAASVRSALINTGLKIGSTIPVGRKSPGTVATFLELDLPSLSPQEQEHLLTKAAVPYRDPFLSDRAEVILQRRAEEQAISNLEPTSHWRKRWLKVS